MSEQRITVWVQRFKDRPTLMLQWHDPDTGRRKSKSAETADEGDAEKARADLEYELNHGLHKQASAMSWDKFRELFEEEYLPHVREETRKVYRNVLNLFERICGPRPVRSINERAVSAFAAGLRKQPGRGEGRTMVPSTVRVRLQFLHTVLTWAAQQKLIPACPKFPAVKAPRKKPQPVPVESFERLLAKAGGDLPMRAFLLCGWLAGLRLAEARALERQPSDHRPWVDFARNRIVLPAEFVKGDADQWVPLDPQLREALEALPGSGRQFFAFVSRVTGKPIANVTLGNRVVCLAKKAGVKLTMKALRRGFGCRHAGKVSAHVLQRLMRHSSISITMDYYANIDDAVEEAILGDRRNKKRNSPEVLPPGLHNGLDATPTQQSGSEEATS